MRIFLFVTTILLSGFMVISSLSDVRAESQSQSADLSATDISSDISLNDLSMETAVSGPRHVIRDMIEGQLRAFREKDAKRAYALVTTHLQEQYKDADTFLMMMRMKHQPITSHISYEFLDQTSIDGNIIQKVSFLKKDGSFTVVLFKLIKGENNQWLIDGYTILDNDALPI